MRCRERSLQKQLRQLAKEIREFEDMNPVPFGEKRFVQLNMTTLENAGEEPEPAPIPVVEETPEEVIEVAAKIARREMFRVRDAMSDYSGNRDGFVGWMVAFFNQHESYCIKAFLEIPIEASVQISERTPHARLRMLECFDEGIDYPLDTVTNEIVEAIYGNDKQERLSNQG